VLALDASLGDDVGHSFVLLRGEGLEGAIIAPL
jgi:hypothetical protein